MGIAVKGHMDREQLIDRITQRTGNSAKTVEKIVDAALDEIYLALKQGDSVSLRNFGSFYVRPSLPDRIQDESLRF
jgi:DNA-binding protein HU-beta